jgi:hypothetical protein
MLLGSAHIESESFALALAVDDEIICLLARNPIFVEAN